ncbi:hypothetical protein HPB52_022863 [Rhipicephalus sanguineus]|uniref:Uncharacterized protein n=1 Tax=Rhipicephalus sanguineus TaxID=34632 RepID=A0A9D4TBY8_RHISA|nr:hypothetical protein HPB52_022863 [Rhipicephalus sanguineus]
MACEAVCHHKSLPFQKPISSQDLCLLKTTQRGQWRTGAIRAQEPAARGKQRPLLRQRLGCAVQGGPKITGSLARKIQRCGYSDLIESVAVLYAPDGPFPDGLYFFLQDSSPIHMANSTACLMEQLGMMLMQFPPQGADMNICENVWG